MKEVDINLIPISEIRVINPRSRKKVRFEEVVASIRNVGLKRPITVSRRDQAPDGTKYDLVCGQGRMEACLALGETTIPAIVTDASPEQKFLMSVVENIARFPPSNEDLFKEVRNLLARNYTQGKLPRRSGTPSTTSLELCAWLKRGSASLSKPLKQVDCQSAWRWK